MFGEESGGGAYLPSDPGPTAKLLATKRRVEAKGRCKAIVREKKSPQIKKVRAHASM
jgi:hypothetical protein